MNELATTPKPGLVDLEHTGAHRDLCVDRFQTSALALEHVFAQLADAARGATPSIELREEVGAIGRRGECAMLRATGGSNTHRGALWAIGMLVAACASLEGGGTDTAANNIPVRPTAADIAARAAALAALPDRFSRRERSNGALARRRYGIGGARAEATAGFPHVTRLALPALRAGREPADVLLMLLAQVDDSCVFHRGGAGAALAARGEARAVLAAGGARTRMGRARLRALDAALIARNVSPGGCADLLAAGLFVAAVAR